MRTPKEAKSERNKRYHIKHKEEQNEKARIRYRTSHPLFERVCPICSKKFQKRFDQKYCSSRCRQNWRQPSKIRWCKEHPEKRRLTRKKWFLKHPEKNKIYGQKRYARLHGVYKGLIEKEWLQMKIEYANTCPACGRHEPDIRLTIDHIIPTIAGGETSILNIQPLCQSCNSKKGRRTIKYAIPIIEATEEQLDKV